MVVVDKYRIAVSNEQVEESGSAQESGSQEVRRVPLANHRIEVTKMELSRMFAL